MKIISLCDYTGNMVKPWAEAGYECICVDTQHSIRQDRQEGNILYTWGDVRSWIPDNLDDIAFIAAFPPCTHLTSAGARDWEKKGLYLLNDAIGLVAACLRICQMSGAPYFIENPVGRLSTMWKKPDHAFHPHEYAGYLENPEPEAYTKKTCLWTGGGFVMPPKRSVAPVLGSKMHLLPPSADRANIRSATPKGFANAVFLHNQPLSVRLAA